MIRDDGNKDDSKSVLRDRLQTLTLEQRAHLKRRLSTTRVNGHALVAEALRVCAVKRVVGISGTPVDRTFPECSARGIRLIGARHQQAAVLMAAAANYVTGRLESVVLVSAGPAVTNALTGTLVAHDNSWPVLVMGGRRSLHQEGIGYFQELDSIPIYQSVTKWAAKVERTSEIMSTVIRGYEIACSGRPGPVYLDLPEDVLDGQCEMGCSSPPNTSPRLQAKPKEIEETAQLLREAMRPLLILGEGIRWSFCEASLRRLVEKFGIPFITTPLARGFLPDDHPLCANDVRRQIQSQADVVLMAGASFDWRFRFGGELSPGARIVHVDIDQKTLGMNVESARRICADSGRFLVQLEALLTEQPAHSESMRPNHWQAHVKAACNEKRRSISSWLEKQSTPMGPQQLFSAIREYLPGDAVVVLDGNITLAAGHVLLSARTPCSWLDPGWNGCMGSGIPFGMGAKLALPERMVVVICGDFGFGLSAMDLETAVRHKISIIVVIANNDGPTGAIRQKALFPPEYPELFSRFQPGLRYERIMEVFGGYAEFVADVSEIHPALERAAASGLPSCINVSVDPDAPYPGAW